MADTCEHCGTPLLGLRPEDHAAADCRDVLLVANTLLGSRLEAAEREAAYAYNIAAGPDVPPERRAAANQVLHLERERFARTRDRLGAVVFALEEAARSLLTAAEWKRSADESPTAALSDLKAWARSRALVAKAVLDAAAPPSPVSDPRASIARYLHHVASVEVGSVLGIFGPQAREVVEMCAGWVDNRLDEKWAAETSAAAASE